jgi:hypothetical protein
VAREWQAIRKEPVRGLFLDGNGWRRWESNSRGSVTQLGVATRLFVQAFGFQALPPAPSFLVSAPDSAGMRLRPGNSGATPGPEPWRRCFVVRPLRCSRLRLCHARAESRPSAWRHVVDVAEQTRSRRAWRRRNSSSEPSGVRQNLETTASFLRASLRPRSANHRSRRPAPRRRAARTRDRVVGPRCE